MKIILFALLLIVSGCKYIDDTKNMQTKELLDSYLYKISESTSKNFRDSILKVYYRVQAIGADTAFNYALTIKELANHIRDSTDAIANAAREAENEREEVEFYKTKAGRIYKKHPEWSKSDCEKLADREIWIGMSIDMVKYLRGLPNTVNKSNYGNGVEYQMCWEDYNPSCFYCKSDFIVTAYN